MGLDLNLGRDWGTTDMGPDWRREETDQWRGKIGQMALAALVV